MSSLAQRRNLSLTDAASKSYTLAQARYKEGIDSCLAVLDSQRALYVTLQNEIAVRLQPWNNRVNLSKVLGGGARIFSPLGFNAAQAIVGVELRTEFTSARSSRRGRI